MSADGVNESYRPTVSKQLQNTLTASSLGVGHRYQGKARDTYALDDKVILVTTDRISAFDRNLASIPFKGQVLNQCSAWWFEQTKHIIPNHVISVPDPMAIICKSCTMFPIEFVVRGFITGSTSTSMWRNYSNGTRDYCGHKLPEGLVKNQRLEANLCTPTTKEEHDRLISRAEIIAESWMSEEEFDLCAAKALELFAFGQQTALKRGLLLVDTKYEFGRDSDGNIILADEIHTPDSSRYWLAHSYEQRHAEGKEPENIDKDILRRWYLQKCDPYKDAILPVAPDELRSTLSLRYIQLYEMITGQTMKFNLQPVATRLAKGLEAAGIDMACTRKVILVTDTERELPWARQVEKALKTKGLSYEEHVLSGYKHAREVLDLVARIDSEVGLKAVFVTITGHSNALSEIIAANSKFPTIACPHYVDTASMAVNVHSTLQMPGGVPAMTVLDPRNCALAVKRILSL